MYRPGGKSTAILAGGRKKVHTTWDFGFEQVEEYDVTTDQLLLRRVRKDAPAGRPAVWEIEVGEEDMAAARPEDVIAASSDQPTIVRLDTKDSFQWRVRNLPYPKETYDITADPEKNEVVIRTTNKKYFKRLSIPDMNRLGLAIQQEGISHTHANRTLVVSYAKPPQILQLEAVSRQARAEMKCGKEGDVDCKQQ